MTCRKPGNFGKRCEANQPLKNNVYCRFNAAVHMELRCACSYKQLLRDFDSRNDACLRLRQARCSSQPILQVEMIAANVYVSTSTVLCITLISPRCTGAHESPLQRSWVHRSPKFQAQLQTKMHPSLIQSDAPCAPRYHSFAFCSANWV